MQSEHIDDDGNFQSDKYPWCAPGFVPLKLTDPGAMKPLWDYACWRYMEDEAFSNDLAICLAHAGYGPAMEAVNMIDGKPTLAAFS